MSEDLYLYAVILLCGLVTYSIRITGFISGNFVREDSLFFIYANYLSYALVGALVTKFIAAPTNALAEVPLWLRLGLTGSCVAIYLIYRKHLLLILLGHIAALALMRMVF